MFKLRVFNALTHDHSIKLCEFMSLRMAQYWKHQLELVEERVQQGNNFFIECEV